MLFSSSRVLDVFIRVPDYLAIIILLLYQHYSTRLEWTILVFRIVTTFRSFHFIFLELSEGVCYLYLLIMLINLEFPRGY